MSRNLILCGSQCKVVIALEDAGKHAICWPLGCGPKGRWFESTWAREVVSSEATFFLPGRRPSSTLSDTQVWLSERGSGWSSSRGSRTVRFRVPAPQRGAADALSTPDSPRFSSRLPLAPAPVRAWGEVQARAPQCVTAHTGVRFPWPRRQGLHSSCCGHTRRSKPISGSVASARRTPRDPPLPPLIEPPEETHHVCRFRSLLPEHPSSAPRLVTPRSA